MDGDLLLVGQTKSVFTDEGDSEHLAVHGLLLTGPIHKLILRLHRNTPDGYVIRNMQQYKVEDTV